MRLWSSYPSGMPILSQLPFLLISSVLLWLFFLFPCRHYCFSYNWVSLVPWVWEKTETHTTHTQTHSHTYTNKSAYNKGFVFVHTFTATWHLEWAPWSGLAWWYCGFLHNPVTQQVISPRTWPWRLTPQSPVALQHRPLPTHRGHRWRIWVIRISRYYFYPLHQWLTVILFTKNKKKGNRWILTANTLRRKSLAEINTTVMILLPVWLDSVPLHDRG